MNTMTASSNGAARYDDGVPERRLEDLDAESRQRLDARDPARKRIPPRRVSTKRLTRDDRPGETFSLNEAAEQAGTTVARVYQTTHAGHRCNGILFRWAPGSEPVSKARHVSRKGGKGTGKAPDASKPVPTPKAAPVAAGEPLNAKELAMLVGALGRSGPVDAVGAEAVFGWAADVRRHAAELDALLAGRADVFVADRIYVRPRAKA